MTDDVAASFAELMASAAEEADVSDLRERAEDEAPYGYLRDRSTGEVRPKKAAGRPRKSPSLDDLKSQREAEAADINERAGIDGEKPGDRAPSAGRKRRQKLPREEKPVPQFREGQISRGMNKLYRRLGKIVVIFDPLTGRALIEVTRKEDEDDVTVGEAWEELARTHPRIRYYLLKMMTGGVYGQLVWAHLPIFMALFMREGSKGRDMGSVLSAMFAPDDDEDAPGGGNPESAGSAGMTQEDMQTAMAFAQQMAQQMFGGRGIQMPREPQLGEDE